VLVSGRFAVLGRVGGCPLSSNKLQSAAVLLGALVTGACVLAAAIVSSNAQRESAAIQREAADILASKSAECTRLYTQLEAHFHAEDVNRDAEEAFRRGFTDTYVKSRLEAFDQLLNKAFNKALVTTRHWAIFVQVLGYVFGCVGLYYGWLLRRTWRKQDEADALSQSMQGIAKIHAEGFKLLDGFLTEYSQGRLPAVEGFARFEEVVKAAYAKMVETTATLDAIRLGIKPKPGEADSAEQKTSPKNNQA
jgi:hypothetical protein